VRVRRQLLRRPGNQAGAPKEDGRVLELVGLQATEGRAGPGRSGLCPVARQRSDAPLDQRAQRLLQTLRELLECLIVLKGGEQHPAIGKVPLPESIERLELRETLCPRVRVERIDGRMADVAIGQNVWGAARACGLERVFVLPFGPGDRHPAVDSPIGADCRLLRQRRAEARPQNQEHDIRSARQLDSILEMPGRQHGLILPAVAVEEEEPTILLRELVDDQGGAQPLGGHIPR
jgi:hypothetical protein